MQICTSPQTDNHASIPSLTFVQAGCPSYTVKAMKAWQQEIHSNLGKATSPLVMQRMHSSALCATSYVMPTADESNHSTAGTIHPQRSATFFIYIRPIYPVQFPHQKSLPLSIGDPHPHHHPPVH